MRRLLHSLRMPLMWKISSFRWSLWKIFHQRASVITILNSTSTGPLFRGTSPSLRGTSPSLRETSPSFVGTSPGLLEKKTGTCCPAYFGMVFYVSSIAFKAAEAGRRAIFKLCKCSIWVCIMCTLWGAVCSLV